MIAGLRRAGERVNLDSCAGDGTLGWLMNQVLVGTSASMWVSAELRPLG
jgi:hypothetical protein